ncbi:helix-turn-helix domain-containing protein [Cupriavidus basilensis]|uniref:helix-turn-helix domain-containing protein n=1 Tax=Cupriavidus basilensis TaxID=68895 RepID=UPI0005B86180
MVRELTDRKLGGFTQVELAKRCGCSQSVISDLKRGAVSVPNANVGLELLAAHRQLSEGDGV